MRLAAPVSKTQFRPKLAPFDAIWTLAAPVISIALRDPNLVNLSDLPADLSNTYMFLLVTSACSILALVFFRLNEGMSRYFSVHDVLQVGRATIVSVASSSVILFLFNRLDGVPRSTLLIFAMVFGGGLLAARTIARFSSTDRLEPVEFEQSTLIRRVILLGVDRFAAVAIKLLDCQSPRVVGVVAALETRAKFVGRTVGGVKIVGLVSDLDAVIAEYAVHGINVDEVWLSGAADLLGEEEFQEIERTCQARGVAFARLSEALNIAPERKPLPAQRRAPEEAPIKALGGYFRAKRSIDIVISMTLLLALAPIMVIVALGVLLDVGSPILFWQQRLGRGARKFVLYKFRTYQAPFDRNGDPIASEARLSRFGRALRASRLDEYPQLLNVLVGDMSLIGPRPLLPHDQPSDPRMRLSVRPGITGWAQVNGGTLVTAEEKDALDSWYVRNASLWLDLKIVLRTMMVVITGEKLDRAAIRQAVRSIEDFRDNLFERREALTLETVD